MTGQETTLGDAIVKAKSHIGDPDVRRTFVLLGDPAMQVKRPSQSGTAALRRGRRIRNVEA